MARSVHTGKRAATQPSILECAVALATTTEARGFLGPFAAIPATCKSSPAMRSTPKTYDTRVREVIARSGNPDLFPELDIPRSTRATWVRRGPRNVVGLDSTLDEDAALLDRIAKLEHRACVLTAVLRLTLTMLRLSGFRIDLQRIPDGRQKQALLFAVTKARGVLPLASVLKVLHLSAARYHAWARAQSTANSTTIQHVRLLSHNSSRRRS